MSGRPHVSSTQTFLGNEQTANLAKPWPGPKPWLHASMFPGENTHTRTGGRGTSQSIFRTERSVGSQCKDLVLRLLTHDDDMMIRKFVIRTVHLIWVPRGRYAPNRPT
ncbi:hypothetical protein SETIT_4G224200v2 [Setaria italica]|uniref:Uncharacterized protein n=1 Tax=Setaria italica TaxID=4555 RepID=A0A368QYW4_SETIT|nr:hypothetical protein SETIT_4G224200v2 [Setaria italica]